MLYICSQSLHFPSQKNLDTLLKKDISHWIYLGEDSTWRIQAESALAPDVTRISIADLLDQKAQSLRDPFLDWIGEMSENNKSLDWWSSEIAAKNPYFFLFFRICTIAAAREILKSDQPGNTLIVCSSEEISRQVEDFARQEGKECCRLSLKNQISYKERFSRFALNGLKKAAETLPPLALAGRISASYQKYLETDLRYRRRILKKYTPGDSHDFYGEKTVLIFTWVDRRNFAGDHSYADPYFGPLPSLLKEREYKVAFVPQILFTIPYEEAVQRLLRTNETFIFPEQFLTPADMHERKKRAEAFNPFITSGEEVAGFSLRNLASEHISETRHLMKDTLRFEAMMKNMRAGNISPSVIIHTCEGHSWEQALSWCVHHHMPGTKVHAYDNVTFSRMVLSMYPSAKEFAIRPVPDRIVTNGPLFRRTLLEEGYPDTIVKCGCAIRHTYLWDKTITDVKAREAVSGPVTILVATAIGLGDSVELVEKATSAFGGDSRFLLRIKCHPLVNQDEVRHYLGQKGEHTNIIFENRSVGELLRSADILLYTYTAVCYEALRYGVVPICVRSENFLNLDKLDATPDIRRVATDAGDLRTAVNGILSMTDDEKRDWNIKALLTARDALASVTESCTDTFVGD